jgi:pimeloyl-ACP methyl ester carboxylesterase
MVRSAPEELPPHLAAGIALAPTNEPPQNLKEYDPEWARAFWTDTVGVGCDHARMLTAVRCPVLFTHHYRNIDEQGRLIGAISDVQAEQACALIRATGQPLTYKSFPRMSHSMHGEDPELFAETLVEWSLTLPPA